MQQRSHRIDFWKKKRKWKTFHRKRVLGRWFKQNAGYKTVKKKNNKKLFFVGSVQELWASLALAVRSLAADQDQIQSFQNFPSVGLIITPRLKKQCKIMSKKYFWHGKWTSMEQKYETLIWLFLRRRLYGLGHQGLPFQ